MTLHRAADGGAVEVDPGAVETVDAAPLGGGSVVHLSGGSIVHVRESVTQVVALRLAHCHSSGLPGILTR